MKKNETILSPVSVMIVDDEEHCIRSIEKHLQNDPRLKIIATITDSKLAAEQIIINKPDLLFLDIQMPVITGFDILEVLNKTSVKPFVVFITAFENYTIQAIRAAAFDYLLKPVDEIELAMSMERALNSIYLQESAKNYSGLINQISDKSIRFNTTGGFIMINPRDIIFITSVPFID